MRGDKCYPDRVKSVKIPLLPNNVGKKSVVFNGLLCTKGIKFKIHLIVHIIMRRVLIFKLVQHE